MKIYPLTRDAQLKKLAELQAINEALAAERKVFVDNAKVEEEINETARSESNVPAQQKAKKAGAKKNKA